MVKITLLNGTVYEGTVQSVDPVSKITVLRSDKKVQLIPAHSIASIDGELPAALDEQADFTSFNPQTLEKREHLALEQAEKQMMSVNLNVSGDVQALFDRLSSIWKHNSIVILEQCQLNPPYQSDCIAPFTNCNEAGLNRISRIVDVEQKKLMAALESS